MARKLASVLIVALMGVPPSIRALGLGELDSDSNLNEPLSARIPLLSIRDNDPVSIHVSLASPDAFKRAGLDRPYYLSRLKFEVKQGSGGYYILVSTDAPLKEPFLDFLLNVRWPQGDLQREYTVLLNPPQYSAGELSTPVQSGAVAVHRAPPQQDASPAPYSSPAQVAVTGEPRGGAREITRYGPVQANQTLWGIASEVRPSGDITVYQTMQALLQDNPGAFIDGNINALLKGSVLRVPTRAVIARIDAKEAALHIRGQLAHWRQTHSNDEAVAAQGQTSTQARPEEQTDNGGKEVAAAATLPSKGRLRVMAARDEAAAQATPSIADQVLAPTRQNILRLQQQLAAVEERNANLQSANGQLQQQASLLKKELINLKSLVSLQLPKGIRLPVAGPAADRSSVSAMAPQGTAASLQAKVTSENPTGEIPPLAPLSRETAEGGHVVTQGEVKNTAAAVDSAHSGPITVENSVAGSGAVTGASGSGRPQPIAAASPPATKAQPKPARHQAQPAAVKPQANPAAQQPVSLKTRLLGYLSQWLAPLVAGVLLALALLLWVVRRRRGAAMPLRRRSAQAGAPDMGQALAIAKLDKATPSLDSANTLQAVTAVAESTPLEEAETCIAYGHYAQAQELLDRALGEQPDSQELRLKLLEVLAAQGDRSGFEAEAQVLHTQVADESDPCWRRAVQLARDIAPDHPLFSSALAVAAETTPARREKSMSTAVTADKLTARSMPQAVTAGGDLGSEEQALDLTVSLDKEELRSGNGREQSTVLEFDLGEIGEFISQQAKENMAPGIAQGGAAEEDDDLESLDFSVPEDWTAPTETKKGNGDGRDRHALQLGELSMQEDNAIFDAERASIAEPDDPMSLDEAGTKLDLARAYLDMGDAAGARSLLNEVVMEGNAAQQSEAQDLLRQTP